MNINNNKLAGKFQLLSRQKDSIYVGLLGNVNANELNEQEIRHIAHFYAENMKTWRVLEESETVPECRFPHNNYNGGIVNITI